MRIKARLLLIAVTLLVVSVLETTGGMAESIIGSRDFGSDDAELLMRLAQAELGGSTTRDKAALMLSVIERAWDPAYPDSIEGVIMDGDYASVRNGSFFTAVPDAKCYQAVEMLYSGWNGKPIDEGLVMAKRLVMVLEWLLPFLSISFTIMLLMLVSITLQEKQERIGRLIKEVRKWS